MCHAIRNPAPCSRQLRSPGARFDRGPATCRARPDGRGRKLAARDQKPWNLWAVRQWCPLEHPRLMRRRGRTRRQPARWGNLWANPNSGTSPASGPQTRTIFFLAPSQTRNPTAAARTNLGVADVSTLKHHTGTTTAIGNCAPNEPPAAATQARRSDSEWLPRELAAAEARSIDWERLQDPCTAQLSPARARHGDARIDARTGIPA